MTQTKPLVSICIPTRNHSAYIARCLESVLAQSQAADLEILVGDDSSDDGTSDIVSAFAKLHPGVVTHLRREPRMGASENMRCLMMRSSGDYIARIDGDDYWLPRKLERQLAYLERHPDCSAVYTNAVTVDEAGNHIGLFNDVGDERFELPSLLRRGNFLNNSSVLFRAAGRQAWLDVTVPQIDFRAHLWHARHGWLGHIGEPLTAYRINARGSMVAGMNDRVRELYWQAIQSVPRELISSDDYANGIADFMRRVFFRAVRTRDWGLAQRWFSICLDASPYGKLHTHLLMILSVLRIASKSGKHSLRGVFNGEKRRILYLR